MNARLKEHFSDLGLNHRTMNQELKEQILKKYLRDTLLQERKREEKERLEAIAETDEEEVRR